MERTLKISDEAYNTAVVQAEKSGVEVGVWIEKAINSNAPAAEVQSFSNRKVSEREKKRAWKKFIGAFDSSNKARAQRKRDVKETFGELVEEKMKRAGIKIPK